MFDVREDHSLNITLQASGYPTPIHYSCLDPLGEPLSDEQCHSGQLTLTNIQKTHAGVYQCFASNTVGKTAMNIHLNVLCKWNQTLLVLSRFFIRLIAQMDRRSFKGKVMNPSIRSFLARQSDCRVWSMRIPSMLRRYDGSKVTVRSSHLALPLGKCSCKATSPHWSVNRCTEMMPANTRVKSKMPWAIVERRYPCGCNVSADWARVFL